MGGLAAGAVTGVLQAKFKINPLLSGILVMTALYSVNLHVMGKSNVPLLSGRTLRHLGRGVGPRVLRKPEVNVFGWLVSGRDLVTLLLALALVGIVCLALYWFFRTELGTAMRATGDNPQMIRALGVNVERYLIMGLALSNGLIALSGALLAQYQGFADVQMGIGMVVWGLASVIIGEALVGSRSLGLAIDGAVDGLGAVPPAGGHRPALGPESERPEAGHRRVRFRRPRAAAIAAAARQIRRAGRRRSLTAA